MIQELIMIQMMIIQMQKVFESIYDYIYKSRIETQYVRDNIKAGFIFENNVVENIKKRQLIWKNGNVTFTIYKHSPKLINVAGVKSAIELEQHTQLLE
jgi:hypothetical protein